MWYFSLISLQKQLLCCSMRHFRKVAFGNNLMGLSTGLDKHIFQRKIVNIFLPIIFSLCFGCSKEPSHWDGSFEHSQHMFWMRNKKPIFLLHTLNLSPGTKSFLTCHILASFTDYQFGKRKLLGTRLRQTFFARKKVSRAWNGSKLFDTLILFLKELFWKSWL